MATFEKNYASDLLYLCICKVTDNGKNGTQWNLQFGSWEMIK